MKNPIEVQAQEIAVGMEAEAPLAPGDLDRSARILARALFRELLCRGYQVRQLIVFSSELIGLAADSVRQTSLQRAA